MRKRRFLYLIFSFVALIFLTALSIAYDLSFFFILMMLLIVIPNKMIKNKERQITNEIITRYGLECDPYSYIEEMKNYASKCFLTKKQKIIYNIYYSLAYIEAGDFDKAKELLLDIDKESDILDEVTQILYLKAWCDYFFYNNFDEKMKLTLLKMREIIVSSTNSALKANYSIIYMILEAKYYILAGVNLDKAKELFKNKKSLLPTKLSLLGSNYQLALLDIKEKNFVGAKEKLSIIASKNDKLFIVRNAKKLLNDINNLSL